MKSPKSGRGITMGISTTGCARGQQGGAVTPEQMKLAVDAVLAEADRTLRLKGAYRSTHEAITVIREDYLELEREVFHSSMPRCPRAEAVQLASAALILAARLPE